MPILPGTKLGPYQISTVLGVGGMGEVYRAHDTRLHRDVAIKVLPERVATDHDRVARFEQEARATAALNHPNIVALYDVGTDRGTAYVVSELLTGATSNYWSTNTAQPAWRTPLHDGRHVWNSAGLGK